MKYILIMYNFFFQIDFSSIFLSLFIFFLFIFFLLAQTPDNKVYD